MNQRLPFYMVYQPRMGTNENTGYNDVWSEENISRRDYDYMKSAYPDTAKKVMPFIEAECDRMEYMGSMMYDEYPDQLQLRLLCSRIYEKVEEHIDHPGKWLMDLIQVLTYQEIMRRRREHRNYRRKLSH